MIWVGIAVLAAVALAPLAIMALRSVGARGRRESAIALHRAQLEELDRDLAEGRIAAPEHANAVLEVQRRLLAAAGTADPELAPSSRSPLWLALAVVPVAALLLYLAGGSPELPAAPLAQRIAAAQKRTREELALIAELKQALTRLDPTSEKARQGYLLLGNAEARLGNMAEAAAAWKAALGVRFDPTLAAETAEALTEANGRVTQEAEALFRRALAEAPANAPWRRMVERRLNGQ